MKIDMRMFAQRAGANVTFSAGSVIFNKGDPGSCMYIVQSGVIEMVIGDKVVEICGPNEAIGFMSMVDGAPRSSTARVKEACELSLIDQRKFRFMVDEVPNFAFYIMGAMARRIRGHESGDVRIGREGMADIFREEGVPHRPYVPCAARRAKEAHMPFADAQQGTNFAFDAAVHLLSGGWA
jgi:CRP-like cAMP-binding protein